MAIYAQIGSIGEKTAVAVCPTAFAGFETDTIQKICGFERNSRDRRQANCGSAKAGATICRTSHYWFLSRESKIVLKNVFGRRESQRGSAMTCFGRVPVKFRQPPCMCERLRLNEACKVTSFSAGFC